MEDGKVGEYSTVGDMRMDLFTSQVIRSSLHYASEEMGIALRNSAYSPNIKERMDHSAALFDDQGRMLAQAEHIPVHLGSLPWGILNTIDYLRRGNVDLERETMIVVNNPYVAGTHLNDVTVIRPIFHGFRLIGYAANKAHHSDVGGKVPGSISSDARSIYEEGFIIDPILLMKKNRFVDDIVSLFSLNSRNPYERTGDIKAQVAANFTGERRVIELVEKYGLENYSEATSELYDYSRRVAVSRIQKMKKGVFKAQDFIESPDGDSSVLKVSIKVNDDSIKINYSGTSSQLDIPLNAVLGVTISGAFYVFKCIMGEDIPVNYGTFLPLEIDVPVGTILNPKFPAPVAGGNVETSQRNADLLFLALSKSISDVVPAASGGSMNNIMVGGEYRGKPWAFYETIGVGLGGRKDMDGVDGVHANMTNTMNTPIEEIEKNLPMDIVRYEFREDSSGAGTFRGGSGLVRAYRIREGKVTLTVLADRGLHSPWGLMGGMEGAKTSVSIISGKEIDKVGTKGTFQLSKGDTFQIETAGGGGFGNPKKRRKELLELDLKNNLISKGYAEKLYL